MTRRRTLLALLVALGFALSGCVSVPTVGPIEKVEGQQQACQNCVSIDVDPPSVGDDPRVIVEGYLRATSNYQPNYVVARQFLTPAAAQKWSPEDGASIFTGSPEAVGDKVTLTGQLIGTLAPDRTFTARNEPLTVDFGLVKTDGEWRIGNPPRGLMIRDYSFSTFYQSYDLYFVGNDAGSYSSLVPDLIYLPRLAPEPVASVLVNALLNGPSEWLRPAVTSFIPPGTTLSVDSVTIRDGIASVALSDTVLALSDDERDRMTAQVVYTLKQVVGVKGILFTVLGQPYRVPKGDPSTQVVRTTDFPTDLDPLPAIASDQLYVLRGSKLELVDPDVVDQARPVPGPLGQGKYKIDSLAVSLTDTDVAVVTDGRTVLRRAPTADDSAEVATLPLPKVKALLRPQFSRFNELWAVGQAKGGQQMWVFNGKESLRVRAQDLLAGGRVVAFKISPDGARLAAVRQTDHGVELGLARVSRPDAQSVTVGGWRVLDTRQDNLPQVGRMADVGWLDATKLLVLGSSDKNAPLGPIRISVDASQLLGENQADRWDAIQLAVLPSRQSALIVGRDKRIYRQINNRWQPFLDGVTTVAYPG